jgi:hypothetical protein
MPAFLPIAAEFTLVKVRASPLHRLEQAGCR